VDRPSACRELFQAAISGHDPAEIRESTHKGRALGASGSRNRAKRRGDGASRRVEGCGQTEEGKKIVSDPVITRCLQIRAKLRISNTLKSDSSINPIRN
jgi:hypothetical protein